MNGAAGAMISVLDACLKDGFGLKSVTSLTVADGIATLNFTGGTAAVAGSTILVSGVTDQTTLNGEKKVLSASSTQVTFATTATNGTAAGTVTFKMAALGWTKPFSGTNLAAYRASAPEATGCYLRVDDTAGTTCRVVGYESMQDINSGSGRFPTDAQVSGGLYWAKSNSGDTNARTWAVFGDDQFFAIYTQPSNTATYGGALFGFGDFLSLKSGDAYGCSLFGSTASNASANGGFMAGDLGYSADIGDTTIQGFVPRASTGIGGAQPIRKHSPYLTTQSGMGNNGNIVYPNTTDNGLLISRVDLRVGTAFRGKLPGVYHTPQYIWDALSTFNLVDGTGEFASKKFMVLRCGTTGSTSGGPTFIDITGPWR
ncbi:hypothetical protein Acf1_00067 [Acidovorax phage ACF1]|nr:hypothetical protein Acf1_00067 [Acidovorax phage ACF1]